MSLDTLKRRLRSLLPDDYDKIDLQALYDTTLTESENWANIKDYIRPMLDPMSVDEDVYEEQSRDTALVESLKDRLQAQITPHQQSYIPKTKFLNPLEGKPRQFMFMAFDIETDPDDDNRFLMCGVHGIGSNHQEIKKIFYNVDDFVAFLGSSYFTKYKYKLVATNLGFDFWGMFYGTEYEKECEPLIRGGSLIIGKFRGVEFIDTMNYAKLGVAKMGRIIGLPKLEHPAYITELRAPDLFEYSQIETYCLRDCEVTFKFMQFLQESFRKLGARTRTTIAATAVDCYRRNYMKEYSIMQPTKPIRDMLRLAYYGGRTEAFVRGHVQDLYKYDYNSCYPAVMRNPYPDPNFLRVHTNPDDTFLDYEGVSRCHVSTPADLHIPFLPMRHNGKLIFPIGAWEGWYSHAEIRKAKQLGYKITLKYSIYYKQNYFPFDEYVEDLYRRRMEYKRENNPMELTVKLLLNSLYGKLAQREEHTQTVHIDNFDIDDAISFDLVDDRWVTYIKKNQTAPAFVNPILAVYTTAYARIKLYEDFERCGLKNVYYCDTDSIFTSRNIESSQELGELKLEGTINDGVIIRPKMYMTICGDEYEYKMKGVQRGDLAMKRDNWEKIINGHILHIDRFVKFRSAVRSKEWHKDGLLRPNMVIDTVKRIGLDDDKRAWPAAFDDKETQTSCPLFISFI